VGPSTSIPQPTTLPPALPPQPTIDSNSNRFTTANSSKMGVPEVPRWIPVTIPPIPTPEPLTLKDIGTNQLKADPLLQRDVYAYRDTLQTLKDEMEHITEKSQLMAFVNLSTSTLKELLLLLSSIPSEYYLAQQVAQQTDLLAQYARTGIDNPHVNPQPIISILTTIISQLNSI